MKRFITVLICIIVITTSMSMMSGCSRNSKGNTPQSTSLVLGVHQYFTKISYNTTSLYSQIYDSAYSWGNVSAVCVDGDPTIRCNYDIQDPGKSINEAKKKQLAKKNTDAILSTIAKIKASTPEINTLQAIKNSADALNGTTGNCQKSMIIFDSGLSTSGFLNFANQNLLDVPVDLIIEQLKGKHAIPNLSDIEVTWIGLGQVCGAQDSLTSVYRYKLQEIWSAVLVAGGAESVFFDPTPIADEENNTELPPCSIVPIIADCLDLDEVITADNLPEVIKFDENTSVKFVADKADFIDPGKAESSLIPIAEYLSAHPDEQLYIIGMTATIGDESAGKRLSRQRAEKCKELMLRHGVAEKQIDCVGLGHTPNVLRAIDVNESGKLIEEMAKLNRAVFFVKSDSGLADTIIKPNV